jgi:hypothetical protein
MERAEIRMRFANAHSSLFEAEQLLLAEQHDVDLALYLLTGLGREGVPRLIDAAREIRCSQRPK